MKLLIVTQTHDATHPLLGFFTHWINAFKQHPAVEAINVITTARPGARIWRIAAFYRAILKDRSDAVFVHMTPLWLVLGWPVWKARGTKMALWYTHGSDSRMLRWAVKLADVTLTATEKAFPFTHARVKAVGHGIAPAFATATRAPRPHDRFQLLAVGRVAPRKRVRETLALFAQIRRLEPRATLTWVGSPQKDQLVYAAQVMHDIQRLGLLNAVTLLGDAAHSDLPRMYAASDLLLHLSDTGSLDKVVLEALATGCPIFSTNVATAEGVGEVWHWAGRLDESAAKEALRRLAEGVSATERARVAEGFALAPLIHRIIQQLTV